MADARFRPDPAALTRLLEHPDGAVGKMLLGKTVQVNNAAKRMCPVDTGRLRSSITHTLDLDRQGLFGRVGTNVSYARHVEFGTSRARAQPFLRPALAVLTRFGATFR